MTHTPVIHVSGKHIRSVRITRPGWAFLVLTVGLGLGGLNTGNNLLYLVFGMLLSMLLMNAILSRSSLHGLSLKLRMPPRLFAGAACPFRIEISNTKKRLPSYALTMLPDAAHAQATSASSFLFKIPAGGMRVMDHPITFSERGVVALPGFRLLTSYPFGLIEKVIPVAFEGRSLVYPALMTIARDSMPALVRHGDFLASERGIGVNPYGIREYSVGDELRHIHWPSVAKVGAWLVREYEQEKRARILLNLLVRDQPPTDAAGRERRETSVSALATLLMQFVEEKREVGLLINGRCVDSGSSGYMDAYLTALALFDAGAKAGVVLNYRSVSPDEGAVFAISEMPASELRGARYDRLIFENGAPA